MMSVLFVCTGNICRSPTADAVLRGMAAQAGVNLRVDSAGTHGYHIGEAPDPRTQKAALHHGVDMAFLRARKIEGADFERFDYLIAMDNGHYAAMQRMSPPQHAHKLRLFLDALPQHQGQDVPDPYYGSARDFDHVFTLISAGCEALLQELKRAQPLS